MGVEICGSEHSGNLDRFTDVRIEEDSAAAANLSANRIREVVRKLFSQYGIPESDLRVYLREDRDAAKEVN